MQTYSTSEIAARIGVHPNTVRFYEEMGFITKPARRKNGYRIYTGLQLAQMRFARTAMRAEVLQNGLRKKALDIVRLCARPDFSAAICAADEYAKMIDDEIARAQAAVRTAEKLLRHGVPAASSDETLNRKAAAARLGVTTDTLRNWELNGLFSPARAKNGYRLYDGDAMERLNVIRTLRCANYSLSAILRLMNKLSDTPGARVADVLDTPDAAEDVISACDHLLSSLASTRQDAQTMRHMLAEMQKNHSTLQ